METGENGVSGALVLRRVNRENNHEHENVTRHRLSMVGNNVLENQRKSAHATRTFLAQVDKEYYLLICT